MIDVHAKHRMHRADTQRIGAVSCRIAHQFFQGLGVAQASIARAAQTVELNGQTPSVGAGDFGHGRARVRRNGERDLPVSNRQLVVARCIDSRQPCLMVELAMADLAVLQRQLESAGRFEIRREFQRMVLIAGHERR